MVALGSCVGVDAGSASVEIARGVGTAMVAGAAAIAGTAESVVSTARVDIVGTVAVVGVAPTVSVGGAIAVISATVFSAGNAAAVCNADAIFNWGTVSCAVAVGTTFSGDGPRFCGGGTLEKALAESSASRLGNTVAVDGGSL